jgi:hypothetical protein
MVEKDDLFIQRGCELNLGLDDDPCQGTIVLTEGGDLSVRFDDESVEPYTNLHESWALIDGSDEDRNNVTIERATVSNLHNFSLTEISTPEITISKNADLAPGQRTELTIDFDLICFQPSIPPINQIDDETRATVEHLSGGDRPSLDIPDEKEFHYISTDTTEVFGVPFTDTTDRVDYIKNTERPVRTGKIRVKQQRAGDLSHRVECAAETVTKILEVSQLVQETAPRYIRTKITAIDDTPSDDMDAHYEVLKSGGTANVSAAFAPFPDKVIWANFSEYIEEAYDNYTPYVRENLHLRQVLGYYIDARDPNRPVEGKLLSVCSAIELLALWHAREDQVSEATGQKIQHLITKLDVETNDLAQKVVSDPSNLSIPEYFWGDARNHVSHGAPNMPIEDLITTQGAVMVLLKRIIRNQLLGSDNESFEKLYSMEPRPSISFAEES